MKILGKLVIVLGVLLVALLAGRAVYDSVDCGCAWHRVKDTRI